MMRVGYATPAQPGGGAPLPVLYVVGTPIGNLEDISARALRVLREVSLIAAEDTRTTRKLLARHGIDTPLVSFHEHSPPSKTAALLEALEAGDVALVSDAGTPAVSDPGAVLVAAAAERGVPVVSVPGPSAVTAALGVSGFPADRFTFLGFLPRRQRDRRALLQSVARQERTVVALEAPHRLRASLADIAATLGDRRLVVCREMTKLHEEVFRGTATDALEHFAAPRGEITLVMEGAPLAPSGDEDDATWARDELRRLRELGGGAREVVSVVAGVSGLPRRQVYGLWLELQGEEATS